jgi:hypothetical protein
MEVAKNIRLQAVTQRPQFACASNFRHYFHLLHARFNFCLEILVFFISVQASLWGDDDYVYMMNMIDWMGVSNALV